MKTGVFFRTHVWDAFVARHAEDLRTRCKGCDFYILADETHQQFATPGFEKFSHRNGDFERLGLQPYAADSLLWYNGDYPLYLISRTFADIDYVVMVEFDVLTDIDLAAMVRTCADDGTDMVLRDLQPAAPHWFWINSCKPSYENVWRTLFPVLVISRLAIEYLFARRRQLTRTYRAGKIPELPYCEGFIATELVNSGFLRHRDLAEFGDTTHFDWWPLRLAGTYTPAAPGHFVHPYLDEPRFIERRLRHESRLGDFLVEGSALSDDMRDCSRKAVLSALVDLAEQRGDEEARKAVALELLR